MTTISSHALQPNTTKAIKASRSWSLRALQISDQAIQANQGGNADTLICSKALAVGSYNLGMLAEVSCPLDIMNTANVRWRETPRRRWCSLTGRSRPRGRSASQRAHGSLLSRYSGYAR